MGGGWREGAIYILKKWGSVTDSDPRVSGCVVGEGGGEGGRGAAYHIRQVHNRLGEVAGEDHRLPHLLELPREVGKKGRLPWASPPRVPLSLGTYQLVVVDDNQFYILGLAVHRGVAPADLEGGWALGISPLHVWAQGQTMGRLVGGGAFWSPVRDSARP